MNRFDNLDVDESSFAFRDLTDQDYWDTFAPSGVITVVGATNYMGRFHVTGKECKFQILFSAATSIATTAGTSYFKLPVAAKGLGGLAAMSNKTTNVAVGVCDVDPDNSRVWLPSQVASGNVFRVAGFYEV